MEINMEKMAIKVTEKVLDDLLYKGKTLREWIDLIIKFEKEYEILPMGKYPASISGCNMEEDKPKEDKHNCDTCANNKKCKSELLNLSKLTKITGCLGWKQKEDTRFICNTCKRKEGCQIYEYAKEFIKQDSNNDMKCEWYIKGIE